MPNYRRQFFQGLSQWLTGGDCDDVIFDTKGYVDDKVSGIKYTVPCDCIGSVRIDTPKYDCRDTAMPLCHNPYQDAIEKGNAEFQGSRYASGLPDDVVPLNTDTRGFIAPTPTHQLFPSAFASLPQNVPLTSVGTDGALTRFTINDDTEQPTTQSFMRRFRQRLGVR